MCRLVQLIPMCRKWEHYQNVSQIFERNGPRERTRENKFHCPDVYRRTGEHVLLLKIILRNKDRLQNSIITVNLQSEPIQMVSQIFERNRPRDN